MDLPREEPPAPAPVHVPEAKSMVDEGTPLGVRTARREFEVDPVLVLEEPSPPRRPGDHGRGGRVPAVVVLARSQGLPYRGVPGRDRACGPRVHGEADGGPDDRRRRLKTSYDL